MPSRLPDIPQTPEDNVPHFCPREFLVLATQRETNLFYLYVPAREEEAKHAVLDKSGKQWQIKALDLPLSNRGFCF
jgi:hypothetical protein